ncbi:hypothetical protein GQ44DRAFT_220515 [Phaeosphaeriaceae sp. PMI808]|nr:hypothetical protein GQ44DRAFT_220515 [Phaeosphaeriaceae sp. PMI808]
MSKKEKKKSKKSKRASIAEEEPSQPATPVDEPSRELAPLDEPSNAPVIEEVKSEQQPADDPSISPAAIETSAKEPVPAEEESATAPLSKKDKKKAKKAKRASTIEGEISQPATPVDEVVKELAVEDQSSTLAATDELPNEPQPTIDEPTTSQVVSESSAAPVHIETVEESTKVSKKEKKKGKKQQKPSESESFLALETPEEANVSDTQSSPYPSIPSETPLLLLGIPTSYPPICDIEFNNDSGESVRDVQVESAEVVPQEVEQDVKSEVVEEKEMERKLEVEEPVAMKQEEPAVEDVDVGTSKKTKKNKKGKKRGSIVDEPTPEALASVDILETTPVDPTATEQAAPIVEMIETQPEEKLSVESSTQVEVSEVQSPPPQPIEEIKATVEETATPAPATPEKKTVKKHKLAAMFEQKASENEPKPPPKRALWAKPAPSTSIVEPIGEPSKASGTNEAAVTAPSEPAPSVDEAVKISEEIALPQDAPVETPVAEPQTSDPMVEIPSETTARTIDATDDQPVAPPEDLQQVDEVVPETESALPAKKNKKSKKSKKQSGLVTPAEIVPEVETALNEEPVPVEEPAPVVEQAAAVEIQETLPEHREDAQPQLEASTRAEEVTPEQVQNTPADIESSIESQPAVGEILADAPSKKSKKKGKKGKKDSGNATPTEDIISKVQEEITKDIATLQPEQPVDEPKLEPEPTPEQSELRQQEEIQPTLTDTTVEIVQEATLPVLVDPIIEAPQQEQAQSVDQVTGEVTQPADDDTAVKLTRKDKKKGKKAKKQLEAATPAIDAPEDVQPKPEGQLDQAAPKPAIEAEQAGESAITVLTEPATTVDTVEAAQQDETLTPVVADVVDDVKATSDMSVEPSHVEEADRKSDVPAPSIEMAPEIPSQEQESTIAPAEQAIEIPQEVADNNLPLTKAEDNLEAETDNQRALDTSSTETTPIPTSDLTLETPVREESIAPVPKKNKKKTKKAKESGTATPISEDVPAIEPEPSQEPVTTEPAIKEVLVDEAPAMVVQEEPVVNEPREPKLVEPPSTLVVDSNPSVDESTLSTPGKKKSKKGKKSETASPIVQNLPESKPETPQESNTEPIGQEDAATKETPSIAAQDVPAAEISRDVVQPDTTAVPTTEVELPQNESTSPLGTKKNKKKSKKSGTATLITEDIPILAVDASQDPELKPEPQLAPVTEPVTIGDSDVIIEDASTATPADPVVERSLDPEQLETPVASQETELDEQVLPAASKKSKKKGKKSGTATPLGNDVAEVQPAAVEQLKDITRTDKDLTVVPEVDTNIALEEERDLPKLDTVITPATTEPKVENEEEALATPSKKKSKKKGRKVSIATSTNELDTQVPAEETLPWSEEPATIESDAPAPIEQAVQEPEMPKEIPPVTEPMAIDEPVIIAPIEEASKVEPDVQDTVATEESVVVTEPAVEDITPASTKKSKKRKGKKSGPSTPAIELSDPIDSVPISKAEDVQTAPINEIDTQPPLLEPAAIDEMLPVEPKQESTVDGSEPTESTPFREIEEPSLEDQTRAFPPTIEADVTRESPEQHALVAEELGPTTVQDIHEASPSDPPIPMPKTKKEKKSKKGKKQPVSLETVDVVESLPSQIPTQAQTDNEKPAEHTIDQTAKPVMEQVDTAGTPNDKPSLSTKSDEFDVSQPELSEVADRITQPLVQEQSFSEQQVEQAPLPIEPDVTEQPRELDTTDIVIPDEPAATNTATPLSRKASKKAKKGKKSNDMSFEPLTVSEQPETSTNIKPTVVEPISEPNPGSELIDAPDANESTDRELLSEPAASDLPASTVSTEPPPAPAIDQTPVQSTSEAVTEATFEPQISGDVKLDEVEDDWGSTSFKKSKKTKGKGKKSKSASDVATPVEVIPEPAVVEEKVISGPIEPSPLEESPSDHQPEELQSIVKELPADTHRPTESSPTPIVETTLEDTILTVQEPVKEFEQQPMEAEDSELALSRSASKKSKKKKGKKGQKIADEAESEPLASEPIDEPPSMIAEEPLPVKNEPLPATTEVVIEAELPLPPPPLRRHSEPWSRNQNL